MRMAKEILVQCWNILSACTQLNLNIRNCLFRTKREDPRHMTRTTSVREPVHTG